MSLDSATRRTTARALVTLLVALFVAVPAVAHAQAQHPSFAGTWVLDAAHSDASPIVPATMKYVITDSAGRVTVAREIGTPQGSSVGTLSFTTDGKPTMNPVKTPAGEANATTTAAWTGATLTVRNAINVGGNDVVQSDAWTLSPDGTKLTLTRNVIAGGQPLAANMILVRQ